MVVFAFLDIFLFEAMWCDSKDYVKLVQSRWNEGKEDQDFCAKSTTWKIAQKIRVAIILVLLEDTRMCFLPSLATHKQSLESFPQDLTQEKV